MSRSLPTHASMGRWARWYPSGVRIGVLLEMIMACGGYRKRRRLWKTQNNW